MRPKGVVYSVGKPLTGESKVALSRLELKIFKSLRLLGASLASFSMTAILYFWGPAFLSILDANTKISSQEVRAEVEQVASVAVADDRDEEAREDRIVYDKVSQFSIEIPAINAYSDVVYNVDPFDEDAYLGALKKGVAHAGNTGLPGQGKRIYMFAHSTNSPLNFSQYNAVFYQLGLLEENDLISVDINEKEYKYRVTKKRVVNATDTHWLTGKSKTEELVLQTCDPPGTTLRRLLVFAERV